MIIFKAKFYRLTVRAAVLGLLIFSAVTSYRLERVATAPEKIIFIENSWNEALKQAAKQHKYIFADAYATWCGPCKMLKENTFTDRKAADFFNANFINVSIDMERGQGPMLAQQWQIRAYPTMIVFDPAGKPVLGTVGYLNANQLIRFGKQALTKK